MISCSTEHQGVCRCVHCKYESKIVLTKMVVIAIAWTSCQKSALVFIIVLEGVFCQKSKSKITSAARKAT